MRVNRRRGRVRVHLRQAESGVLGALFDDLGEAFGSLRPEDPVRQRLFPDGYRDDDQAAAEFRELTESSLRAEKLERLGQCRAEVPDGGGQFDLEPEAAQRWLAVLNDLRLALGTRLGVTEDDDPRLISAALSADPQAQSRALYYWLTALQDSMVNALMG